MDETHLIAQCLDNNRQAQKELVQRYAPVLLTIARRYSFAVLEPEDILQESFILIFTHLDQHDAAKGNLFSWMRKIVINTALKYFQSEKYKINGFAKLDEVNEDWNSSGQEPWIYYDAEHWMKLIQSLPHPYGQVFNLSAIDGYSHKEIGEMLNIEESTSRTHLHRARKILLSLIHKEKLIEHGIKSI